MAQQNWANIIRARAPAYNLDPVAALAVAMVEGLSGGVDDQGTSFGPFQLHEGGALPAGRGQAWAESPAGIEYALRSMAGSGAAGLHGPAAVQAIVRNFERPAAPDAEIARALAAYGQAGKLGGGESMPQAPLPPPSAPATSSAPDFHRQLALALLNSNDTANDPGFFSALGRAGATPQTPQAQPAARATTSTAPGSGPKAVAALHIALKEQGVPYKWGGTTPSGFDCSGLIQFAYGRAGISVPRTSEQQWAAGRPVTGPPRAGDAVFFRGAGGAPPGHEAMYIGNGNVIVAPHTGGHVQIVPLNSIGGYMGARRFA